MSDDKAPTKRLGPDGKPLPAAAVRALEEAEARKREAAAKAGDRSQEPKELGGPKGEEPTRFGDWERSGRAVDF